MLVCLAGVGGMVLGDLKAVPDLGIPGPVPTVSQDGEAGAGAGAGEGAGAGADADAGAGAGAGADAGQGAGAGLDDGSQPPAEAGGRQAAGGRVWYVNAAARAPFSGSRSRPFAGLQAGLEAARPGDTVVVAAGVYTGEFRTVRPGVRGAPITLLGRPGAVVRGHAVDEGRVLTVGHDWIVVAGLRVTRGDKGIWLQRARHVTVRHNTVDRTGGECVRLKYFAVRNEIASNRIGPCGLVNFDLKADRKNGEGVYIGTAPEQLSRNPTGDPDASNGNWVHHNVIATRAECVDVKESAERNVVERNRCTGSIDPKGSGLDSRGNLNVFRYNTVTDVVGKGVRLGGDTESQGVRNEVYGNTLLRTGGHAVGSMRLPQQKVCGNVVGRNLAGASNQRTIVPTGPCR